MARVMDAGTWNVEELDDYHESLKRPKKDQRGARRTQCQCQGPRPRIQSPKSSVVGLNRIPSSTLPGSLVGQNRATYSKLRQGVSLIDI